MTPTERQLTQLIKAQGYKITSDKMGIYFKGHSNMFSFIKTGDIYNCYYNKNIDGEYQLQDKLQSQIMLDVCLRWVLSKISQNKN